MKKALVILAALATCLTAVPAAAAQTNCNRNGTASADHFRVRGTVAGVDTKLSTLTVKVWCGGRGMRAPRGQELTAIVSADTQIFLCQEGAKTPLGLSDLRVGDRAKVCGTIALTDLGERVYTATKVVVHRVVPFRVTGTVRGAYTELGTITVKIGRADRGLRALQVQELTARVSADTKIYLCQKHAWTPLGLGDVKAGDQVMVCGRMDLTDPDWPLYTARLILDRPAPMPGPTL